MLREDKKPHPLKAGLTPLPLKRKKWRKWAGNILIASRVVEIASRWTKIVSRLMEIVSRLMEIVSRLMERASRFMEIASRLMEIASRWTEIPSRWTEIPSRLNVIGSRLVLSRVLGALGSKWLVLGLFGKNRCLALVIRYLSL